MSPSQTAPRPRVKRAERASGEPTAVEPAGEPDVKRQRGYRATDAVYLPAQARAAREGVALASIIDAALIAYGKGE